jgi:hypothetical protein
MYVQTGKTFIATVIAVILSLGGIAVLSSSSHKGASSELSTEQIAQAAPVSGTTAATQPVNDEQDANDAAPSETRSGYEDGYKAGYRDGHQDCTSADSSAATAGSAYYSGHPRATRAYYARSPRRVRVAGTRYTAEHRGHSTRNMILTIAGPAAVGAGIGGIIRGGKGAGIGALLGGGGGALYYLAKHRRR